MTQKKNQFLIFPSQKKKIAIVLVNKLNFSLMIHDKI